ncbi:hypothetical protein THAOC_18521 [Thalassiosira oceanica]|uniref:Uncharacterized protein n=1 Tax=Thalassiosira oceanica TaxID=159749 RepID=K0SJ62_THAOC|nr:hypothetical protein THAOC_18521 [Thalassiosira oceanica]|eukprot:EJK61046.1 hypothetical protein THAOC_18521 [Thalassiosira oceanica]
MLRRVPPPITHGELNGSLPANERRMQRLSRDIPLVLLTAACFTRSASASPPRTVRARRASRHSQSRPALSSPVRCSRYNVLAASARLIVVL